jgi:SlyX protein
MYDEALEKIETKLAFLERANGELSDVVFRQQGAIDALRTQVAALGAQMRASLECGVTARTPEEERPPHY